METINVKIAVEPFVIAVFSDSHGYASLLPKCAEQIGAAAVIHLGDHARDARKIDLPQYVVNGNCDFSSDYPNELLLEIGSKRVLLTHGHFQGVKYGLKRLCDYARELGAQFALYGHTHIADIYRDGGVVAANPGSLTQPRLPVQGPCFGKLVYVGGELDFQVLKG